MTPQAPRRVDFGLMKNKSRSHVRYSVGGFTPGGIYGTATPGPSTAFGGASGPRRVRVVEPWKVTDITVPLKDTEDTELERENENEKTGSGWLGTPKRNISASPSKRERLSEEERQVKLMISTSRTASHTFYHVGYHPEAQICPYRARFLWRPDPRTPPLIVPAYLACEANQGS